MKLAEALIERADIQKKLAQLSGRISANVSVQEGNEPTEDILDILNQELPSLMERLESLIVGINRTNSQTELDDFGTTLTEALAHRDILAGFLQQYNNVITYGSLNQNRYSNTELRNVVLVDIKQIRKLHDEFSKAHRELDVKIQTANWTTDLVE